MPKKRKKPRKVNCLLTKNLKENYEHWVARMAEEAAQKEALEAVVEANVQVCHEAVLAFLYRYGIG